jgi:hypothetical protein
MARQSIDLSSHSRTEPIEFRYAKVTTASTESAVPYTSVASIYRGMWLGDSTARAAELTGAVLWTRTAVAIDDWLICIRTPFGRWDGLPAAASIVAGTTEGQVLRWNNSTKAWEAGVKYVVDWRLDKTNHKFQAKYSDAPTTWVDITDANGGTLDAGVPL